MANINPEIEKITSARYGEEVRGSIAKALNAMNEEITQDTATAKGYARQAEQSAQRAINCEDHLQAAVGNALEVGNNLTQEAGKIAQAEARRVEAENARVRAEAERMEEETGLVAQAKAAAKEAERYANADYARIAKSWAEGGTGARSGEETHNAAYWANQARTIAQSRGVTSFKGRSGAIAPQTGDYTSSMIMHDSFTSVQAMLNKLLDGFKKPMDFLSLNGDDFCGYFTEGGKRFYFSIPLPPMLGVTRVNIRSATCRLRQGGNYILGAPTGVPDNLLDTRLIESFTMSIHQTVLACSIKFKNKPTAVANNDLGAISITASLGLS